MQTGKDNRVEMRKEMKAKSSRREFVSGIMALAAYARMGGRIFGATRPEFGFDITQCDINSKFRDNPLFSGEPICGVNYGFLAKRGYFNRESVRRMPAEMRASGVNFCMLNTHFCQETFASTRMFLDSIYSSGEVELQEIVKRLQGEGIHVVLKPCLTLLDSAWMGRVKFPETHEHQLEDVDTCSHYWGKWFASLRDNLRYFGEFAERNDVKAVLVGAEYTGTLEQEDEWRKTIADFRTVYGGPCSYEFTCDPEPAATDKSYYEWNNKLGFIDDLDFLAWSWYPRARPFVDKEKWATLPHISLEEMVEYLRPAREQFESKLKMYGRKPVIFTETGIRSAHGCTALPWDAFTETTYDAREQADYMEALFRTFAVKPQFAGLFWWKWDETQKRKHYDPDPRKDRGFIIRGKPACDVFRRWSGRGA